MTSTNDSQVARLLLLIDGFSEPDGRALDGLTKLAKLDFLLRYPQFLQVLNERLSLGASVQESLFAEELPPADPMIRYKYGPWDERYYSLIGSLVGRGLVAYTGGKGRVALRVTGKGRQTAASIAATDAWSAIAKRITFLRRHYDLTGSRLKELIYETFPDALDRPRRSPITGSPRMNGRR